MKLKKKAKRIIILILLIVLLVGGYFAYTIFIKPPVIKEAKVISEVEKYGYQLKDNKTKRYKDMFAELKEILSKDDVDEEEYVKKISEMFIYDFYSLNDKTAKTDVGGVDFVYDEIVENFLQNAQSTYYKYIENNIYNNRKQSLPVVGDINIESAEQEEFAYGEKTDDKAFKVKVTWSYTDTQFSNYQREAELVFIHDDIKLCLVELQ